MMIMRRGRLMKHIKFKRVLLLVLALMFLIGQTQTVFAGTSSATASVKAIVNTYTAKAYVSLTQNSYAATTTYGTTAKSISVSITVKQKSRTTGKALGDRTASSEMKNTTVASVSGTSGSTAAFVSASSTHKVVTTASSWSKTLSGVYA